MHRLLSSDSGQAPKRKKGIASPETVADAASEANVAVSTLVPEAVGRLEQARRCLVDMSAWRGRLECRE